MAKVEIVKFLTEDNLELQGFLIDSGSAIGILHIPGLAGNFYENSFLDAIEGFAGKRKITFLSINTRGHDYVNDLIKIEDSKHKIVNIGGALEKFEDCIYDINAGIDFLKRKGCDKIILQGHSYGCQKIIYYQFKTNDKNVIGLILLAPADDMNIARKILGKDFEKTLKFADDMIKNNKTDEFMPKGTASLPIISAGRLHSLVSPSSTESQLFNYEGKMKELASITLPILAVFGSKDIYLTMPAEKTLGILKSKAVKSKCDTAVIKNAPHNFRGYEKQLVEVINKWLDDLI